MRTTRNRLAVLLTLILVAVFGTAVAQASTHDGKAAAGHNSRAATTSQKAIGDVFCVQSANCDLSIAFNNAFDIHVYTVFMGANATTLTVDTMDCCIAGDHWGVVANRFGGTGLPVASGVGSGSTTAFSGAATISGTVLKGRVVQVTVFHAAGVSDFPAGLDVRFRSNAPIQKVTQRAGQG
jgi:hypothetical protein